jgi:hypothetical protein
MSRRKLTKADFAALNRGRSIKVYPANGGSLSPRARAYSPVVSRARAGAQANRAHPPHPQTATEGCVSGRRSP